MYFKEKKIKGKKYKYAIKAIRLPDGKVLLLEKTFKGESKKQLKELFQKKEAEAYTKYMLKNFKIDSIFNKSEFTKIEKIRTNYKRIIRTIPKESLKDLLNRFTANFTYESNALEGNSLTLKDVAIVMFENVSIKGKDLREIYETRNSRKVVEMIMKNKFSIEQKDIIKMHKMLMKDMDERTGYKKLPNVILGRRTKTTPPEKVKEEMEELIRWYKKNKEKYHPIKLASVFHGKFEQIHPFEDGNGRVGRFLINIMLTKNKYPPLIIRKSQRIAYLNALGNFDSKHTATLERFILDRFKDTYKKFFEIYIKYI